MTYSSAGGASEVGFGFELLAAGAIERKDLPRYDETDGFVYRRGKSRIPLVKMGRVASGEIEYRINDNQDWQFLYRLSSPGSSESERWTLRTPDGRVATFLPSLVTRTGVITADARGEEHATEQAPVAARYVETKVVDVAGNVMEFEYESPTLLTGIPGPVRPQLVAITYGGNDGSAGAPRQGPSRKISIARRHHPRPVAFAELAPPPRPEECTQLQIGRRPAHKSLRSGGVDYDYDEIGQIWGIAVETSTETSDTALRSYDLFTYDWDRSGCTAENFFLPKLIEIRHIGVDIQGNPTEEKPIAFEYFPAERTFRKIGPFSLPTPIEPGVLQTDSEHTYTEARFFRPTPASDLVGLEVSIAGSRQILEHYGIRPPQPNPPGTIGRSFLENGANTIRHFQDIDGDGWLDYVDWTRRACQQSVGREDPVWYRHLPETRGFFSPSEVRPIGFSAALQGHLLVDNSLRFNCDAADTNYETIGGRALQSREGPTLMRSSGHVMFRDVDADGHDDLLTWQPGGGFGYQSATFDRNGDRQYLGRDAFVPCRSVTGGCQRGVDPQFVRVSETTTVHASTRRENLTPGELDLTAYNELSVSDSGEHSLLDIDGDGLLDMVTRKWSGRWGGDDTLFLQRGVAPGRFGDVEVLARGSVPEGLVLSRVPSRRVQVRNAMDIDAYEDPYFLYELRGGHYGAGADPNRFVFPRGEEFALTVSAPIDWNADGLIDIVAAEVEAGTRGPFDGGDADAHVLIRGPAYAYLGYGHGFEWIDFWNTEPLPRALEMTKTQTVGPGGTWQILRSVTKLVDYNGDGFVDRIGTDVHDRQFIQFNIAGTLQPPRPFSPRLPDGTPLPFFGTRKKSIGATGAIETVLSDLIDMDGNGRVDLVRMIEGTNQYEVYLDADPHAPPNRLRKIRQGESETDLAYEMVREARQEGEPGVPSKNFVVSSVTRRIRGMAPETAEFIYGGPHWGRSNAVDDRGTLLSYARGLMGFERYAVCEKGIQHQTESLYQGDIEGMPSRTYLFGRPTIPEKCEFLSEDHPSAEIRNRFRARLRQSTSRQYESYRVTSRDVPAAWVKRVRLKDTITRTHDPDSGLQLGRRESFDYAMVAEDRPVLIETRSETVAGPEGLGDGAPVHVAKTRYAAYPSADTAHSYRIVPFEASEEDGDGGVLSLARTFYDGLEELGAFTRGFAHKTRVFVNETRFVDTRIERNAFGQISAVTSPSNLVTRYCHDPLGLFVEKTQGPDGLIAGAVHDAANGLVIEAYGPTNLGTAPMRCAELAAEPSFAPRREFFFPDWKVDAAWQTPVSIVVEEPETWVNRPPAAEESESAPRMERLPSQQAYWASGVEPDARTPLRLFEAVHHPLSQPAPGLREIQGTPRAVVTAGSHADTQKAVTYFDGLGRAIRSYRTVGRDAEGFFFAQVSAAEHQPHTLGALTRGYQSLGPNLGLETGRAIVTETVTDAWGHTRLSRARIGVGLGGATWSESNTGFGPEGLVDMTFGDLPDGSRGILTRVYARDALLRATRVADASGREQRMWRGLRISDGRLVRYERQVDAMGFVTETEADSRGQALREIRYPSNDAPALQSPYSVPETALVSEKAYDAKGRILRHVDPIGAVVTWAYDRLSRPIEMSRFASRRDAEAEAPIPLKRVSTFYLPDGRIDRTETTAPASGARTPRVTQRRYDTQGRLERVDPPAAAPESGIANYGVASYVYEARERENGVGLPILIRTPSEDVALEYTADRKVWTKTRRVHVRMGSRLLTDAYRIECAYDFGGHITGLTFRDMDGLTPGPVRRALSYEYDPVRGSLKALWDMTDPSRPRALETYGYNASGALTGMGDGLSGTEALAYDALGRVVRRVVDYPVIEGAARTQGHYENLSGFYANGLLQWTTEVDTRADGGSPIGPSAGFLYGYDGAMRITGGYGLWRNAGETRDQVYSLGMQYRKTLIERAAESYPDVARMSLRVGDYAGIGIDPNILSGRTVDVRYRYDGLDPAQVTSTVEAGGAIFANLEYDAFGVRTARNGSRTTPDPKEQIRASEDAEYAYDPEGQLSFAFDDRSDKVYGLWKNELVAEYDLDESGEYRRGRTWLLAQRSRVDIASGEQTVSHMGPAMSRTLTRNARGAARRVYAPFGQKLFEGGSIDWLPGGIDGFHGSWADPSGSGLMRMGDRWYGPDRIWTSPDPEWTEDTYGAFANNPLSFSDPDGHQPRPGDTVTPQGQYRECPPAGCERLENFRMSVDETLRGYDNALGELDADLGGALSFGLRLFMHRQMAQGLGPARLPGYRWGGFSSRPQLPSGGPIRVEARVVATRPWSGGHQPGDGARGGVGAPTTPSVVSPPALQAPSRYTLGPGVFQPAGTSIPRGLAVAPGQLRFADRPEAGRPPAGSIPLGSGGFMNAYLQPEQGIVYGVPNVRQPVFDIQTNQGHANTVNALRESSDRLRSAIPPMTYEGQGVVSHPYVPGVSFRDASPEAREATNDEQIRLIADAYRFCEQNRIPTNSVDTDDRNFYVARQPDGRYHLFWPDPLVPREFRRDGIP